MSGAHSVRPQASHMYLDPYKVRQLLASSMKLSHGASILRNLHLFYYTYQQLSQSHQRIVILIASNVNHGLSLVIFIIIHIRECLVEIHKKNTTIDIRIPTNYEAFARIISFHHARRR